MIENNFNSNFNIGDFVVVDLEYAGEFKGQCVGVKFQLGKVYYDVDVYPYANEVGNEKIYTRFRDIASDFIQPDILNQNK